MLAMVVRCTAERLTSETKDNSCAKQTNRKKIAYQFFFTSSSTNDETATRAGKEEKLTRR